MRKLFGTVLLVLFGTGAFAQSQEQWQQKADELSPGDTLILCYVSIEAAARVAENQGDELDRSRVRTVKNAFVEMYAELEDKPVWWVKAAAAVKEEQVFREIREQPMAALVILAAAGPCMETYQEYLENE